MYNYQTYLKESKLQRKFQQIKKDYYETRLSKESNVLITMQESEPVLVNAHKRRIEGFIMAMVEKPEPVNVYRDVHYSPRSIKSDSKATSIHEKSFHLNHLTEKQRINDATSKNAVCDVVPFSNTFSHQFRDFKDEGSLKPMRYKSINSSLRIKQELDSVTLNYLPNLNNKKIDKLAKSVTISWKDKDNVNKINKSLLPLMHKKNYYQSLKSIFSQSPNGFMKNMKQNEKDYQISKPQQYDDADMESSPKKQKKIGRQTMNRRQNSREAMIKCGLLGGEPNAYVIGAQMYNSSKKVFSMGQSLNLRI